MIEFIEVVLPPLSLPIHGFESFSASKFCYRFEQQAYHLYINGCVQPEKESPLVVQKDDPETQEKLPYAYLSVNREIYDKKELDVFPTSMDMNNIPLGKKPNWLFHKDNHACPEDVSGDKVKYIHMSFRMTSDKEGTVPDGPTATCAFEARFRTVRALPDVKDGGEAAPYRA